MIIMIDAIPKHSNNPTTLTDYGSTDPDRPKYKMMLKDITPRLYQETILGTCATKNCLVVIPTGLGKTVIALMLAAQRLMHHPNSKILFLAPTRPLVEQHLRTFENHMEMENDKLAVFTGQVKPEKRALMWKESKIIFSTPQGLENDIITNRIDLKDVSLIIFDEAHRATGDYAYNFVAKQYDRNARYPRILALTASPGSDLEKINEVCQNLFIEDVELRSDTDPDVKPYIQDMDVKWVKVELPEEFYKIQKYLKSCYDSKLNEVKNHGYVNKGQVGVGKKALIQLQGFLHGEISRGDKSFEILKSVSLVAEAMKAEHALELLETQGITPLQEYFDKLFSEAESSKVKATKNLAADMNFKAASILTRKLVEKHVEHPKVGELKNIIEAEVKANPSAKIMIFNQFRDSAKTIEASLNSMPGVSAKMFFGQAKKKGTGLSQKEQKQMIQDFSNGEFNCLVATSVAEEGIDVPSVDLVVFYEPVPSGIRTIQRRGRTGRQDKGRVIVLVAKGTRDEAYRWSAHHKENRMKRELNTLKSKFAGFVQKKDTGLDRFISPEKQITIIGDYREKASGVMRELVGAGAGVQMKSLTVGDYILSPRVVVEYKKVPDFVDSIVDGRLLEQLKKLKEKYERPMVVIEGEEDVYSQRKIHPNAIRGMLATITVSYGIPVLQTKNAKETADLFAVIAKREQDIDFREYNYHGSSKPMGLREQQEYIVSSLPGIGPGLAKPLLEKFGSVKEIVNAGVDDLQKVDKIGEKKAKEVQKVLGGVYVKKE